MAVNSATSSLVNQINSSRRITGLTSGLDTDTLVKSLLAFSQTKIDQVNAAMSKMTWKKENYQSVNNMLRTFRDDFTTVTKQSQNMVSQLNYLAHKAKIENGAGEFTVTTDKNASVGSHTMQIKSLAQGESFESGKRLTGVGGNGLNLSDSLSAVAKKLKDANPDDASLLSQDGTVGFAINGKNFSFKADQTLGDMINAVNTSDAGVTMSYTQLKDKLVITEKEGSAGDLTVSSAAGDLNGAFGLAHKDATKAKVVIDGIELERDTNAFTIDGMNFKLNRTTEEGKTVNFGIERDIDSAVDMVKKYVEEYNKTVVSLNKSYSQKPNKAYQPLTEEQRAAMSESEVKLWDEKSKEGLLYNDSGIATLRTQMRSAIYEPMGASGKSMFSIGISTLSPLSVKISTTESRLELEGTIELDEDKLRAALTQDPNAVFDMFAKQTMTKDYNGNEVVDRANSGFVTRINDVFKSYISSSEDKISFTNTSISRSQSTVVDMLSKFKQEEERYYAKFTAMETALSKLQAQTSYFSSLSGG